MEGFPRGGKKTKGGDVEGGAGKDGKRKPVAGGEEKKKREKKTDDFKLDRKLELSSINYDSIAEGVLCLGCVRKVYDSKLLVGLPGMTVGIVDIHSISSPYSEILEKIEANNVPEDEVIYPLDSMFRVGDVVVVKVMSVVLKEDGKQHRISLSLNPKDVHQDWRATDLTENIVMTGAVKSKEDKGYIIDLGIKGVSAFLPTEIAATTEKKLKRKLGVGQLLSVNIAHCQIKRLMAKVTLNSVTSKLRKICVPEGQSVKLLPGMRTSCIVMEKRLSGLTVSILDTVGRVHNDHLGERYRADVGDTVFGRVLLIPPWDIGPYITFDDVNCLPYSTEEISASMFQLQDGDSRKRRGFVMSLEPRGAKVKLHGGGVGLLKRQRATDKLNMTDDEFKQTFREKSEHDFRLLEYSPLDGLFILSCQKSHLEPSCVLSKDELKPGTEYRVTILSYNEGGAVTKLSGVKGFIPYMHFKDKILPPKLIQKKFPPGSTLKAIVFLVDVQKNCVVFTAKKALRATGELIATSYDQLQIGATLPGVIRLIPNNQMGLNIQLLGGLFGFVPKRTLPVSLDPTLSLNERFPIGSVIEIKVKEVDLEKKRAIFIVPGVDEADETKVKAKQKTGAPQKKKRQRVDDDSSQRSPKKKKRKSETGEDGDEIVPNLVPIAPVVGKRRRKESDVSTDPPEKKKRSKNSSSAQESKDEKGSRKPQVSSTVSVKRESDDSGIEDESCTLKLPTKGFWDVMEGTATVKQSDSDSDDDTKSEPLTPSSKLKSKKEKAGVNKEMEVQEVQEGDSEMSEKDFEAQLIQKSTDPRLWKSYKEFLLKRGDSSRAISLMKQMQEKIPFRDEKGKLLCWMMMLEIETQYGTESAAKTMLEAALKVNDPVAILDRLAKFLESQENLEGAEELYRRRLRIKQDEPDSWLNLGQFLYKHNKLEIARRLLSSALQKLSEANQIYITAKFAKMEIEHGDLEKGRSIFLTICLQRPKRVDLWLLYANSLYKMKEFQLAGDGLRSALSTKRLTPKEARPLLQRLMEIEKLHGTADALAKLPSEFAEYLSITNTA